MVLTPQAIAALIADSLGKRVCLHNCFFFFFRGRVFCCVTKMQGKSSTLSYSV